MGLAWGSWHHHWCPPGGTESPGVPQNRFPFPRPGTGAGGVWWPPLSLFNLLPLAAVSLGSLDTPWDTVWPLGHSIQKTPGDSQLPPNLPPGHPLPLPRPPWNTETLPWSPASPQTWMWAIPGRTEILESGGCLPHKGRGLFPGSCSVPPGSSIRSCGILGEDQGAL